MDTINRTVVEIARCLLLQCGIPTTFWAEAINTANHVRNLYPISFLNGMTQLDVFSGHVPDVGYFKEFGNNAFVCNNEQKLERSNHETFLESSWGIRIYPKVTESRFSTCVKLVYGIA